MLHLNVLRLGSIINKMPGLGCPAYFTSLPMALCHLTRQLARLVPVHQPARCFAAAAADTADIVDCVVVGAGEFFRALQPDNASTWAGLPLTPCCCCAVVKAVYAFALLLQHHNSANHMHLSVCVQQV